MASYEQAKSLLNHSVSRPTLYSLDLKGKSIEGVTAGITELESEYIKLFCNNIEFPGLNFEQVTTLGQEDMGIMRAVPGGMKFGAGNRLRFTVVENSDFGAYDSLRKMFNSAVHRNDIRNGANPLDKKRSQRMNYYEDYRFNAVLRKLEFPDGQRNIPDLIGRASVDHGYKVVATYTFEHCYLSQIDPVTYNSNEPNTYTSFTSTMRFENYYHDPRKYMYGKELPGYPDNFIRTENR